MLKHKTLPFYCNLISSWTEEDWCFECGARLYVGLYMYSSRKTWRAYCSTECFYSAEPQD